MTRDETLALLGTLKSAYPARFEITREGVEVWASMLLDLGVAEATSAARAFMAESPHPPTIADIRNRAARARSGAPDPDEAWAEVVALVAARGRGKTWHFSHPAVAAAARGVGEAAICNATDEGIATTRAHFLKAYEAARGRSTREENIGRLELATSEAKALLAKTTAALKAPEGKS